jgi:hypothetical protein
LDVHAEPLANEKWMAYADGKPVLLIVDTINPPRESADFFERSIRAAI